MTQNRGSRQTPPNKPQKASRLLVLGWTPTTTLCFLFLGLAINLLPLHGFHITIALTLAWIVAILASQVLLPERITYALFFATLPCLLALGGALLIWCIVAVLIAPNDTNTFTVPTLAVLALPLLLFGSYLVTDVVLEEIANIRLKISKTSDGVQTAPRNLFENLNTNGPAALIQFKPIDSKENYLAAFWRWVQLMADDRYDLAAKAIQSPFNWEADQLRERVTTFFGGKDPWTVVIPNDRLIGVIYNKADYQAMDDDGRGWFMAQIPLTTEPDDPKADDIPLAGLAVSFFVLDRGEHYELFFEIFHA